MNKISIRVLIVGLLIFCFKSFAQVPVEVHNSKGYLDRWGSFAVNGEALQVDFALNGSGKDSFFIFLQ